MFREKAKKGQLVLQLSKSLAALAGGVIGIIGATVAAGASTVIWDFNLPATATSSQSPPYPSVARLTLEDTVEGVKFTLDPNENNPGYTSTSSVNGLNIVYSIPLEPNPTNTSGNLPSSAYSWISGPVANAYSFGNNNTPYVAVVEPPASDLNMDSSYTSPRGQLLLSWNNPDFLVTGIASWVILGTTIEKNFSILASSNSNPSPVFGIFSVSDISLDGWNPTPSNWVTGSKPTYTDLNVGDVPVPAALPLLMSAFGVFGFLSWRRRKQSNA